jgi:hypothetical protein
MPRAWSAVTAGDVPCAMMPPSTFKSTCAIQMAVCTCIRSYTTTSFVWISSSRLDGRLIQPCELCATRSGAMHSPSGSLLTLRVSYWTHWKSVDRHVPCADVVPLGLDGLGLPEARVGRPTRVLWTEPQRPFGFSELP